MPSCLLCACKEDRVIVRWPVTASGAMGLSLKTAAAEA